MSEKGQLWLPLNHVAFLYSQGLWHPARKVRETYWRIYNNLYIGAQDALVAFNPSLEDDDKNTYMRHELDIML